MLPYYIASMDPMDMENRKIPSHFSRPRLQRFWPCPAPCARRAASWRRISAALPGAPAVEAAGRRGASRGHGPHGVQRRGGARLERISWGFMGILMEKCWEIGWKMMGQFGVELLVSKGKRWEQQQVLTWEFSKDWIWLDALAVTQQKLDF